MTQQLLLIALLGVFAFEDWRRFKISNITLLPAIATGIFITGNWHWAIVLFLLGACLFANCFWAGGDVKLFSCVGAFLGIKAIGVFILTLLFIWSYRRIFRNYRILPVGIFTFLASLFFL